MSRIGKKPIIIPENIKIEIENNSTIKINGPKGDLSLSIPSCLNPELKDNSLILSLKKVDKASKSLHGTFRTLVNNAIIGVISGFEKKLEIHGTGYKASLKDKDLVLELGYSHPIIIKIPSEISCSVQKNIIILSGPDKQKVGELAAKIKKLRPVEPYKGKGIRYVGELIKKKAGKKAKAALGEGGSAKGGS